MKDMKALNEGRGVWVGVLAFAESGVMSGSSRSAGLTRTLPQFQELTVVKVVL